MQELFLCVKEKFLAVFTGKGFQHIAAANATRTGGNGKYLAIRALVPDLLQVGVEQPFGFSV